MTQLNRVRVGLTGFSGGPGVATFYFLNINTARQSLQSLWNILRLYMPDDVTIQVEASGDIIESTTGDLVGSWSKDAQPPMFGTSTIGYAAPAGFMIRWATNSIVASRRVKGRTFVVPAMGSSFSTNGQVIPSVLTDLNPAVEAFRFEQSLDFVIWNRPFIGAPATPLRAARPPRLGSHSLVTAASVSPKVAVLRSRRD